MDVCLGIERFRTFDIAEGSLQSEIFGRVPGDTAAVRIETWPVEVITVFIRFAPGEYAAFDFDISPNQTSRGDPEGDVGRVLPVMPDRRVGIVHCRRAMHECRWTQRWFAGITEIKIRAKIVIEFL